MKRSYSTLMKPNQVGFTIVELLIVIVVIGILTTLSIVSYRGMNQRATVASIKSDLVSSYRKLSLFQIDNDDYPNSITDCPNPSSGNLCLKASGNNQIAGYVRDNTTSPKGFCINIMNGNDSYKITSSTYAQPVPGDCAGIGGQPVATTYTTIGSFTYTVPNGIKLLRLEVWGSRGDSYALNDWNGGGVGGFGGYSKGDLVVNPGDVLYINVGLGGGVGGAGYSNCCEGVNSGKNGGGASDVRYGGNTLDKRKIVAGGGGGGGGSYGADGFSHPVYGANGGAGGGSSGSGPSPGTQMTGISTGIGANGAGNYGAGGGGGGYYGGAAGAYLSTAGNAGPASGGSGYIGGVLNGVMSSGVWGGPGKVVVTTIPGSF